MPDSAHGHPMDEHLCMVDDCDEPPQRLITVSSGGLRLVYAVCVRHKRAIRAGEMVAEPAEPTRGLVGLDTF